MFLGIDLWSILRGIGAMIVGGAAGVVDVAGLDVVAV